MVAAGVLELAFSGSAQFALLTTLPAGSAAAGVAAAILINARYVVMGVALNDSLRGNRAWRALQAQALADASFVVAQRGGGQFDIARLVGASVPQWLCWVSGTAVGVLARPAPQLLHHIGADVVFPAFFLMLAMEEVRRSPRALLGAAFGATASGALLVRDRARVCATRSNRRGARGRIPQIRRIGLRN